MKKFTLLLMLSIVAQFSFAQNNDFVHELANRFTRFWLYTPQEKVYLHTDKPYYSAGENIWIRAYLVNAATHRYNTRSRLIYVELLDNQSNVVNRIKLMNDSADANGRITLPPTIQPGFYTLRAYTYWMQNAPEEFFFHKGLMIGNSIAPPKASSLQKNLTQAVKDTSQFDLQFFPESGTFLDNQVQTIAFKAIGTNGLAKNISGKIYNQMNEDIVEFNSFNAGMGKFTIKTNPGETYYALVNAPGSKPMRLTLPATKSDGIGLNITGNRGKVLYQLMNQSNIPDDSLYLLIHARGVVLFTLPFAGMILPIPEQVLPEGICSFSVIDKEGNLYCERIYFNRNPQRPTVSVISSTQPNERRKPVEVELSCIDGKGNPWQGKLSASITDKYYVNTDNNSLNIRSYLLLTSDIKGYVENPDQYFVDDSPLTREKTDLLMLTQGWKRFETAGFLKRTYPKNDYYLEEGQIVSGKVLNILNKPAKDVSIIAFVNYLNQVGLGKSDSTGRFFIDNIMFPDSTSITLKAKSKSKLIDVEVTLVPDKEIFPGVKSFFPTGLEKSQTVPDAYNFIQKEKYVYEGGNLSILLSEFTVEEKTRKTNFSNIYSTLTDYKFDGDKLESMQGLTIMDMIAMFPNVQVYGDVISIQNAKNNPLFVIDGIQTDRVQDIQYLNTSDIEEIGLIKGPNTTMFGSRGANGVINIALKKGVKYSAEKPSSLINVQPLGFQKPAQFYVPKYEVDSVRASERPDLRTTIAWMPNLIPDANGKVKFKYYTADRGNDYEIEMEGIGKDGSLVRFTNPIIRNY